MKNCKLDCTLYEVVHVYKPNLQNLKMFESVAFVHKAEKLRKGKVDSRAEQGNSVGYSLGDACQVLL